MEEEELNDIILTNISNLGIEIKEAELDSAPAFINCCRNLMVYDKSQATAFVLAHEMIHAKYHDESRCNIHDVLNPCEKRANTEAIQYLWEIFLAYGGELSSFNQFATFTKVPFDQATVIIEKMDR